MTPLSNSKLSSAYPGDFALLAVAPCVLCGAQIVQSAGVGRRRLYCPTCRKIRDDEMRSASRPTVAALVSVTCDHCGESFATRKSELRCPPCRLRARQRHRRSDRQRAVDNGVDYEPIDRLRVYDRDGWVCQLCDLPVDPSLRGPDVMCASLDHVTPIALGGPHIYANVQLAHFLCNSQKGARAA
jgi:5-methylcytosine-specific restriction endonuclease McrA